MSSQADTSQQSNVRSLFFEWAWRYRSTAVPLSEVSLRKRWVRTDPDALSPFQLAASCGETADLEFGYFFAKTFRSFEGGNALSQNRDAGCLLFSLDFLATPVQAFSPAQWHEPCLKKF
jgi:hypothetical protein